MSAVKLLEDKVGSCDLKRNPLLNISMYKLRLQCRWRRTYIFAANANNFSMLYHVPRLSRALSDQVVHRGTSYEKTVAKLPPSNAQNYMCEFCIAQFILVDS